MGVVNVNPPNRAGGPEASAAGRAALTPSRFDRIPE
jgi:hypothetical protein